MSVPIVKDRPFVQQSMLTGRWWLVTRWRDLGNGMREATEKFPFDEAVAQIRGDSESIESSEVHPA